jgi:uncharacterized membrane protein
MTYHENPHSTARIGGHPLHPMIVPFPIAFFISAFVTDIAFLRTNSLGWADASMWLLGAGLAMALLAAALGLTDFLGEPRVRRIRQAWLHMGGNVLAVALAAGNFALRAAQGPADAISPAGVTLSAVVAVLLLFNGWMGWALVYRHHVGISDERAPADETLQPVRVRSR